MSKNKESSEDSSGLVLKRSLSLKTHVIIMVIVSVLIASAIMYAIALENLNEISTGMTEDKAFSMVSLINEYIDVPALEAGIEEGSGKDDYLTSLNELFVNIRSDTNISYLYIIQDAGTQVSTIIDGFADTDENKVLFGEMEPKSYYENIDEAFLSGEDVISDIYTYEEEGRSYRLISAYMPIKNASGKVLAVLGCDIDTTANQKKLDSMMNEFLIVFVTLVAIFAVVCYFICWYRFHPLAKMVKFIEVVATGDFTVSFNYTKGDEIGKINYALSLLVNNLRNMLKVASDTASESKNSADTLDTSLSSMVMAVQNVSIAINSLSASTVESNQSIDSGMNNMNELDDAMSVNSANLEEFIVQLETVSSSKDEGLQALDELEQETVQSSATLQKMNTDIRNTSESIKKIGGASTAISDIASQTNLLALNATIEAARAGEAGKGFAVVAEEIRILSENSNKSVEEINTIIKGLLDHSDDMVRTMEELEIIMNKQVSSVGVTENKFNQISDAIQSTQGTMTQLKDSTEIMNRNKTEIAEIFKNITNETTENAATTEEISASMEEQTAILSAISEMATDLSEKSESLNHSLSGFKF